MLDAKNSVSEASSDEKNVSINDGNKRKRKSVLRLSEVYDKEINDSKEKKNKKMISGSGVSFGDLERFQILNQKKKIDQDLLKILHNLCYRSIGTVNKRLSNLKKFNGYQFNENDYNKRLAAAEKTNGKDIKLLCDVFDIDTKEKSKKDLAESLTKFIQKPIKTDSLKFRSKKFKIPKKKTKKVAVKKKSDVKKKLVVKKNKIESDNADIEGEEDAEEVETEEEGLTSNVDDMEVEDFEELNKEFLKNNSKVNRILAEKQQIVRSNEENVPSDCPVSRAEMSKTIDSILKKSDLNSVTMKTVLCEVVKKYEKKHAEIGEFKVEIKNQIREILTEMSNK